MTEDATLSEFASGKADADSDRDETDVDPDTDGSKPGGRAETKISSPDQSTELTPVTETPDSRSTYAVGDYTCEQCGETTDRVWRDDDVFVCPDCKSW